VTQIAVYSPRKITPQNKRNLPETHDPEKRTTYVQITLDEQEIAEAIRNYLRAQIPISDNDTLPVVLYAGRGENGHTAAITITPLPVQVVAAHQPGPMSATFDAVTIQAFERSTNKATADEEPEEKAKEPEVATAESLTSQTNSNPNRLAQKAETAVREIAEAQEAVAELIQEATAVTGIKKSNLFKDVEPVKDAEPASGAAGPPAHAAATPPSTVTASETFQAIKPKAKSIFDTLAK